MARSALYGIMLLAFAASIIRYPGESFQAALQGLSIWWNIVFPGLLPFLALSELLFALGFVHAAGVLLEPVMRRLFRLPGCAGWAVALGWTAGFPAGPDAAARLHRDGALTDRQSRRLLALSHMPSPMLMLIVVGAGFLRRPELGMAIAAAVWLSALAAGMLLARLDPVPGPAGVDAPRLKLPLAERLASAMQEARRRDGRGFGQAMGESITSSVQRLMTIGGLIIAGAVFIRLLERQLPDVLQFAAYPGFYELHLGAYFAAGRLEALGLPLGAASIAAALAWSGWSGLLASQSAFAGSGPRLLPFAAAKLLHALLAFGMTLLLWKPAAALLGPALYGVSAAFLQAEPSAAIAAGRLPYLWQWFPIGAALTILALIAMAAASFLLTARRPSR